MDIVTFFVAWLLSIPSVWILARVASMACYSSKMEYQVKLIKRLER